MMKIRLRYFAALREALGPGEEIEVPPASTLGQLRDQLLARGGQYAEVLARGRAVRCALNLAMSEESVLVSEGAEVAFFPPVTGG